MSQSDPLADSLTRIRNAVRARLEKTEVPDSRMVRAVVDILKREGFIQNYRLMESKPRSMVRIYLRYTKERRPFVSRLARVSKPGLRRYVKREEIPLVLGGAGISILSTSKGILTDAQARAEGVGGELLCQVS